MISTEVTGSRIAQLRKQKGMTQKELAEKLAVTDKAVSKWETGRNFPDLTLLEPLAETLDTTVLYLLSLENTAAEEAVDVMTVISASEQVRVLRELRTRSRIRLGMEIVLFAAAITASKIMADHGIWGLGQAASMGMLGFIGTLIGTEWYAVRNLGKLMLSYNALLKNQQESLV